MEEVHKWLENEIDQAIKTLSLSCDSFFKLGSKTAVGIIFKTRRNFVVGNPSLWWMSLRNIVETHDFPSGDGYLHLLEYVPKIEKRCWFIPEPDEQNLLVYSAEISNVPDVVGNCNGFGYYIVDVDFKWLVAETSEDQIIVCHID